MRMTALLTMALLACSAGLAGATDQMVYGRSLKLKVSSSGKEKLSFTAKKPPLFPAPVSGGSDDPTTTGASLEIRALSGEVAVFQLPASNWTKNASGTVFKFKNKLAPNLPSEVKVARMKSGVLKVSAKDTGITLDETTQSRIGIVLNSGTTRYCALFGGVVTKDEPGRFYAKKAPAPTNCPTPVVPTTTTLAVTTTTTVTTSSSSTTTTISPLCGNGIIDPNEQCEPGSACGAFLCNANCTCPCDFLDTSTCLYPFPNDYFTRADGTSATGRRVDFDLSEMPQNIYSQRPQPRDYNWNDGWSPGSTILLKVPGIHLGNTGAAPITDIQQSLNAGAPIVIVDAGTLDHHLFWAELDANAGTDADRSLILHPAINFKEGHRYIVALRDVKDASNVVIPPSADFLAYRDITPFGPGDGAKEARRPHMESLFTTLGLAGVPRANLYLAWDFTVSSSESMTGRMLHIRDDAFTSLGLAAPSFTVTKVENEVDSKIYRRVTGTFYVPRYVHTTETGAIYVLDSNGMPVRQATDQPASFICTIPRATLTNAVADGVPARISIYGHGLLGSNTEVNSGNVKDMGNEHNFVFCATPWIGMSNPDIPTAINILVDLELFPTLTDRLQQGFLNQLYLARLMKHIGGFAANPAFQDALGNSLLDTSDVFYDGNSQGGIFGGTVMAIAQDITRGVLGVPAMNYATLLTRSVDFDAYSIFLYPSYPNELERPLLLALIQMLWDRSDPNGYAHHMTTDPLPNTPPHKVLIHEAFGDHQVTNVQTEVEARTIGALIYQPALQNGRHSDVVPFSYIPAVPFQPIDASVMVVWDSGTPTPPTQNIPNTGGSDPHGKPRANANARIQKSEFLKTNGKFVDVCANAPCMAP